MKIFYIGRRMILFISLGIIIVIGFGFSLTLQLKTVLDSQNNKAPKSEVTNKGGSRTQEKAAYQQNPKNIIFGIDPGHGGIDSGTKWGKLCEKELNLSFSRKLAEGLKKKGYQVVLTRNKDQLLTPLAHYSNINRPYKRDDLIRRIQKLEKGKASIVVCIHVNWNNLSYHRGPIVYYYANSPESQKIAQHVQEQLNRVQPFRKLPKPSNYYVLQEVKEPAILVELGFFSNPMDLNLLQDDDYLEKLKFAIIRGLEEAL